MQKYTYQWSPFYAVVTAFVLLFLCSQPSFAQVTTRRNMLPGTTAALVGGAFAATADDASASWYNPAGLGFVHGNDVTFTANTFTATRHQISDVVGTSSISESSTSLYPGFGGGTLSFGSLGVGYSYFTTDKELIHETDVFQVPSGASGSSLTYNRDELAIGDKLYVGTGVGFGLGGNFAIGIGEFYYRRSRNSSLQESSVYVSGATFDSSVKLSTLNEGTMTSFGVLFKSTYVSIGLSERVSKALANSTKLDASQVIYTGSVPDRSISTQHPRQFDELSPTESTFGISVQPWSQLHLECDVIYYTATKSNYKADGGFDTRGTIDESCGASVDASFLTLRGGIFSNNALVAKPTADSMNQPPAINYIGFSGGLGYRSKSFETGIGLVVQKGRGYEQPLSGRSEVVPVTDDSRTYLLTSRHNL